LGLCDSGAEVNVINSSVVEDLFTVVRGKIQLKPFFGDSIAADLVSLTMSLSDKDAINVWCAVVDKMSDDLILSADTVQRLTQSKISAVTTRSANADTRIDDNDAGDVTISSDRDCGIGSPLDQCVDPSVNSDSIPDHQNDSGGENDDITNSTLITKAELIKEQRDDDVARLPHVHHICPDSHSTTPIGCYLPLVEAYSCLDRSAEFGRRVVS